MEHVAWMMKKWRDVVSMKISRIGCAIHCHGFDMLRESSSGILLRSGRVTICDVSWQHWGIHGKRKWDRLYNVHIGKIKLIKRQSYSSIRGGSQRVCCIRTLKRQYQCMGTYLIGRLKAGISDLCNWNLLMVSLLCRDDRCIGHQREVDPWVGD